MAPLSTLAANSRSVGSSFPAAVLRRSSRALRESFEITGLSSNAANAILKEAPRAWVVLVSHQHAEILKKELEINGGTVRIKTIDQIRSLVVLSRSLIHWNEIADVAKIQIKTRKANPNRLSLLVAQDLMSPRWSLSPELLDLLRPMALIVVVVAVVLLLKAWQSSQVISSLARGRDCGFILPEGVLYVYHIHLRITVVFKP
ncbi:hypothetical protein H1R20_g4141, partial [Candolleomyces eurysporus]